MTNGSLRQPFSSAVSLYFSQGTPNSTMPALPRIDELDSLMTTHMGQASLILAKGRMNHILAVRPTSTRSELGNLLVVAPTRGGKGLLAVSQLLSWGRSVNRQRHKGRSLHPDRRLQGNPWPGFRHRPDRHRQPLRPADRQRDGGRASLKRDAASPQGRRGGRGDLYAARRCHADAALPGRAAGGLLRLSRTCAPASATGLLRALHASRP